MTSTQRVSLIEYRDEWLDELVDLWRASFEAGVGVKDPHPLAEQRQYFVDVVPPHNAVRLAVLDGRLVGFIAASEASVAQLFVRIGFQRCGIGTRMLAWAKARCSGSLWLYTFERNRGAYAFYTRSGFTAVARGFEPEWQLADVKYQWPAPDHAT